MLYSMNISLLFIVDNFSNSLINILFITRDFVLALWSSKWQVLFKVL